MNIAKRGEGWSADERGLAAVMYLTEVPIYPVSLDLWGWGRSVRVLLSWIAGGPGIVFGSLPRGTPCCGVLTASWVLEPLDFGAVSCLYTTHHETLSCRFSFHRLPRESHFHRLGRSRRLPATRIQRQLWIGVLSYANRLITTAPSQRTRQQVSPSATARGFPVHER